MTPRLVLCAAALLGLAACATRIPNGSVLHDDPAHPATTSGWVRTELYFGTGPADDPAAGVDERRWREFLDREVSTRFPDGLSVYDAYGQWRGKGEREPERLRSKVIVLLHPDTPERRADVEAIRAAWKRATGEQSVLRVTQPADVSF